MRPPRDPAITPLGFTCYRLEAVGDHAPDEPAFMPVEIINTRNAMGVFMLAR